MCPEKRAKENKEQTKDATLSPYFFKETSHEDKSQLTALQLSDQSDQEERTLKSNFTIGCGMTPRGRSGRILC